MTKKLFRSKEENKALQEFERVYKECFFKKDYDTLRINTEIEPLAGKIKNYYGDTTFHIVSNYQGD